MKTGLSVLIAYSDSESQKKVQKDTLSEVFRQKLVKNEDSGFSRGLILQQYYISHIRSS